MVFEKMAEILKPGKVGNAEIRIIDYTNKELGFYECLSGIQHEKYAALYCSGKIMMSETPMEHRTNREFIDKAHGDILIGGLGIGMIVMPIQNYAHVNSITILEINENVIDLVKPMLPLNDKVRVLCMDAFTWKPDRKFDCIYMDIWPFINTDIYKEMVKLKRKYAHYLKPSSESPHRFNRCWAEFEAKNSRRLI